MSGDQTPPDTCAVGGCENDAIARLYEHATPGPRCRECLLFDLDHGGQR